MPDRDQILQMIDDVYAARSAGDRATLSRCWSADATLRIAGRMDLASGGRLPTGKGDANAHASGLIDLFQFHDLKRLHAVVEGDTAAVHWHLRVSSGGGEPVDTEVYDLWKVGPDGKIHSLVQFVDTALMKHLLDGEPQKIEMSLPA